MLPGPALGKHMRKPGCNGAVCYCNNENYCNGELPLDKLSWSMRKPGCNGGMCYCNLHNFYNDRGDALRLAMPIVVTGSLKLFVFEYEAC